MWRNSGCCGNTQKGFLMSTWGAGKDLRKLQQTSVLQDSSAVGEEFPWQKEEHVEKPRGRRG